MKKFATAVLIATAISGSAFAADLGKMPVKAAPPPPPPSPWDIAFGAAIMSDYNFRGVTQSNHKPSVAAYFEPRFNVTPNVQLYAGVAGESISFPNNAAAEIDFYGGIRPTFGPIAFDVGFWYYWYPGGREFNGLNALGVPDPVGCTNLPTPAAFAAGQCNFIKKDVSFWEVYGKATYTVNDQFLFGGAVFYSPSVLNSGADGTYLSGNAKYTFPAFSNGVAIYLSGEVAHWWLGTTDAFYANTNLPDYTTWNVGVGFTWKVFTLDLRYYDTDLSKGDCNAFTSDHTATFATSNITAINPSGLGSNWCSAWFVAKLSADLTLGSLK